MSILELLVLAHRKNLVHAIVQLMCVVHVYQGTIQSLVPLRGLTHFCARKRPAASSQLPTYSRNGL